jgi:hypothetical protein
MRKKSIPMLDEEIVYETKLTLKDRRDVKPFTLSAFGLAEPTKQPEKSVVK